MGVFRVDVTLDGAAVADSPYQLVVPFPFSGCGETSSTPQQSLQPLEVV